MCDEPSRSIRSPTGTTRKVIESIAQSLAPKSWSQLDLTYGDPEQEPASVQIEGAEAALIGMPVHFLKQISFLESGAGPYTSHVDFGRENSWDTQAGHVNKKKGLRFHVNP